MADTISLATYIKADPSVVSWTLTGDGCIIAPSPSCGPRIFHTDSDTLEGSPMSDFLPSPAGRWILDIAALTLASREPQSARAVWCGRRYTMACIPTTQIDRGVVFVARPAPRLELEDPGAGAAAAPFVDLGPLHVLTRRELEVLALLGEGLSLGEIAERFSRSVKTVKRFRDGIAQKLGIGDRTRLGMISRDLGLELQHASLPRLVFEHRPSIELSEVVPRLAAQASRTGADELERPNGTPRRTVHN